MRSLYATYELAARQVILIIIIFLSLSDDVTSRGTKFFFFSFFVKSCLLIDCATINILPTLNRHYHITTVLYIMMHNYEDSVLIPPVRNTAKTAKPMTGCTDNNHNGHCPFFQLNPRWFISSRLPKVNNSCLRSNGRRRPYTLSPRRHDVYRDDVASSDESYREKTVCHVLYDNRR